jgi:hypothetical protein
MMKLVTLLIVIILLSQAATFAQSQADVCHVATSWWNPAKGIGSGNMLLGQFRLSAFNEQTLKSFKDESSGLIVNAGVEYGDFGAASAGKPTEIRIAIAAFDREQNAFDVTENAVAGTTYGRRWGSLYVEKQVVVGQLIHTFAITCGDGSKRKK